MYAIVHEGKRPEKPENASAVGLSDPLWNFAQRCWDADEKLRPGVGEVVAHVGAAVANWDGLMPPSPLAEDVDSVVGETSDSRKYSEFEVLTLSWYHPLSNGTDGLFQPTSDDIDHVVEEVSDSKEHCELEILTLPWYRPLSNGTDGLFPPTKAVSASRTDSGFTLELFT